MNIQDQDIYREVERVVHSGGKQIAYHLNCIIHTPTEDIDVFWVEKRELMQDYALAYAEELVIGVVLGSGTFNHKVVPHRDILEVTFIRTPLQSFGDFNPNEERQLFGKRYKAKLLDNSSSVLESNIPGQVSLEKADRTNLISVRMQLIEPVLFALRLKTFGGTLKQAKPREALRAILGSLSTINSTDGNKGNIRVHVADNITEEVFANVPIPVSKLVHFPLVLNQIVGGLYPTGLGRFFKDLTWYVYPIYDTSRFKKERVGLTLVNVTADKFPNPEVSFLKTDDQVVVISTGQVKHIDRSESLQLNVGNGVRYLDAKNSFKNFAEVKDNKIYVNKDKNTKTFLSELRKEDEQWVPEADDRVTSFHNLEASKISERLGSYVMVSWENCDESVLRPGMPVRFLYMDGQTPTELFGTLLSVEVFDSVNTRNVKQLRHLSNASLTIFIQRNIRPEGLTP